MMMAAATPEAEDIQCVGYRDGLVVVVFKDGSGNAMAQASLAFVGALDLADQLRELVTKLRQMGPSEAGEQIVGHA
jgi:hypothetical protein